MRPRRLVAPVLLVACLASPSAFAKRAPLIEDPAGDYPVAVGDLLTADITTLPAGKGKLVITIDLASAPTTSTPYSYSVNFNVEECAFRAIFWGHPLEGVFAPNDVGCSGSSAEGVAKVTGTKITFTVPLGGALKKGAELTEINASTHVSGMAHPPGSPLGDAAATDKTYKIGTP